MPEHENTNELCTVQKGWKKQRFERLTTLAFLAARQKLMSEAGSRPGPPDHCYILLPSSLLLTLITKIMKAIIIITIAVTRTEGF